MRGPKFDNKGAKQGTKQAGKIAKGSSKRLHIKLKQVGISNIGMQPPSSSNISHNLLIFNLLIFIFHHLFFYQIPVIYKCFALEILSRNVEMKI